MISAIRSTRPRFIRTAILAAAVLTVAAVIVTSLVIFWRLQDPDILVVKGGLLPVRPDKNVPGQVEYMGIDYCKVYEAKGTVVARMVGRKSIIRLPWPVDNQPPQCLKTEVPIVIPVYATGDTYYFDFTITYKINPIKDKVVYLRSQNFTVSKDN